MQRRPRLSTSRFPPSLPIHPLVPFPTRTTAVHGAARGPHTTPTPCQRRKYNELVLHIAIDRAPRLHLAPQRGHDALDESVDRVPDVRYLAIVQPVTPEPASAARLGDEEQVEAFSVAGVLVDGEIDGEVWVLPAGTHGGRDGGADVCACGGGRGEDGGVYGDDAVGGWVAGEGKGGDGGAGGERGEGEGCGAELGGAVGPAAAVEGEGYRGQADAAQGGDEDLVGVFEGGAGGDGCAALDGEGYGEGWGGVGGGVGAGEEEVGEEGLEDEEDAAGGCLLDFDCSAGDGAGWVAGVFPPLRVSVD